MEGKFRSRALAVTCAVAVVSMAACGSDDSADTEQDERGVRQVIAGVQKAYKRSDGGAFCRLATEDFRRYLGKSSDGRTCVEFFESMISQAVEADVFPQDVDIEVKGDKASATGFTGHTQSRQRAYFAKTPDGWRMAAWFRGQQKEPLPWVKAWAGQFAGQ